MAGCVGRTAAENPHWNSVAHKSQARTTGTMFRSVASARKISTARERSSTVKSTASYVSGSGSSSPFTVESHELRASSSASTRCDWSDVGDVGEMSLLISPWIP